MKILLLVILLLPAAWGTSSADQADVVTNTVITNMSDLVEINRSPGEVLAFKFRGMALPFGMENLLAMMSGGVVVFVDFADKVPPGVMRGDIIEAEGLTYGNMAHTISASRFSRIGEGGKLPDPMDVGFDDIISGLVDMQWARVKGVVRRVESSSGCTWVSLRTGGGRLHIMMPYFLHKRDLPVGSEVEVSGVIYSRCNECSHAMHPYMVVLYDDCIRIIDSKDPFSLPVYTPSYYRLPAYGHGPRNGIRFKGVVSHRDATDGFWISCNDVGVHVRTWSMERLEPGDEVDVFGFVSCDLAGYSLVLEDAVFRKHGKAPVPQPVKMTSPLQASVNDARLVEIQGTVGPVQWGLEGGRWEVINGTNRFDVLYKGIDVEKMRDVMVSGSSVRLTGICVVDPTADSGHVSRSSRITFRILMRSASDVQVLQPASWWTPRNTAVALGISTGSLALVLVAMMTVVRVRMRREAEERRHQEAVDFERIRIAKDLHDVVGANLGAISLLAEIIEDDHPEIPNVRNISRTAVSSIQGLKEIVWMIDPKHDSLDELIRMLRSIAEVMLAGMDYESNLDCIASGRPVSPEVRRNILPFFKEILHNVRKHARASKVVINGTLESGELRMTVADNGCGFDPASSSGGNGLGNLRQRVKDMHGEISINSSPGSGTSICFRVPVE